jgi:invasion protein IalB
MRLISAAFGAASLALISTAALAQAPSPQPNGAGAVTESKQVGDWSVRCFAVQNESPCDMYQELQDQNSHQRVLSVSIAYVPARDQHVIQIAVPLGIGIQAGATIKTDAYASPKLPYRRCDQLGCYIEMLLSNQQVDDLAKSGPQASVNIVADDGKPYALKFSLNGFAGAHDAMAGLAKQKAVSPPAAAAPAKK